MNIEPVEIKKNLCDGHETFSGAVNEYPVNLEPCY